MIHLNPRERKLAIGLGLFVLVFGIYSKMIRPVRNEVDTLSDTLPQKQQELAQVTDKASSLADLTHRQEQLEQRVRQQSQEELMPYLDQLIRRFNLESPLKLKEREPLESIPLSQDIEEHRIRIRWENIELKDLLSFLAVIDAPENLCRIQSLDIQHHPDETTRIDVKVTIARPQAING